MSVRPAKTQISLGICPVWSESSLSAWRNLGSLATHWGHSEDSDQTGWMPRLIWVFAGRTVTLLVLSCRGSNAIESTRLLVGGHFGISQRCYLSIFSCTDATQSEQIMQPNQAWNEQVWLVFFVCQKRKLVCWINNFPDIKKLYLSSELWFIVVHCIFKSLNRNHLLVW